MIWKDFLPNSTDNFSSMSTLTLRMRVCLNQFCEIIQVVCWIFLQNRKWRKWGEHFRASIGHLVLMSAQSMRGSQLGERWVRGSRGRRNLLVWLLCDEWRVAFHRLFLQYIDGQYDDRLNERIKSLLIIHESINPIKSISIDWLS